MTYLIDAWLDRRTPYLRILNRETGKVCAELDETALEELKDLASWICTASPPANRGW